MSKELAAYIAEYINEEWDKEGFWIGHLRYDLALNADSILKAVDAYEGGAR